MRFRQGAESAFAPAYEVDSGAMPGATAYASYPGGQDSGNAGYTDAPFAQPRGITLQLHKNYKLFQLATKISLANRL
jgi:hypothetical protein